VLEVGGEVNFLEEALGAQHRRELGVQYLDRDPTMVPQVLGEPDRGHAAAPELALDHVAVSEGVR
jgi:hypothetical protein